MYKLILIALLYISTLLVPQLETLYNVVTLVILGGYILRLDNKSKGATP